MDRSFWPAAVAALTGLIVFPGAVAAAPGLSDATRIFNEAKIICERDGGRLWGRSLCGPMLLVDYTDRGAVANQADAQGRLIRNGAVFRGVLPEDVNIANTPTEWAGTRWTQIIMPAPDEPARRHVLLAHELFHRIQPSLGLSRPDGGNQHLDTLEGRYLLQLEWRALAAAVQAPRATFRRAAIADALAFRRERYRLFQNAAADEGALEIAEGVPEYTGVMLGLETGRERIAYAVKDLSAFVEAPSFVRSFAYATGPAIGLLLDQYDPGWRGKLNSGKRLDQLLAQATGLASSEGPALAIRIARYDDGTLRAREARRDEERRARLAAYRARLVDGPVLVLPLVHSNRQFNPQTLAPLEGLGTIYPTLRLVDDWGVLEVESGGALMRNDTERATVSIAGADRSGLSGDGWTLKLNPGWKIQPGDRRGDLKVVKTENEAH